MESGENTYRRFLLGDRSAFDELVLMYRNGLEVFINSFVHNVYAAEDIAVDTFVYVLTHKNHYNFSIGIKSYLYMIGRSRAIDYLRREKRYVYSDAEDNIEPEWAADTETMQDKVIAKERSRIVFDALNDLPDEMRKVIYLLYFEELSYKEVAKVLKMSTKKVDNLNYRGKAKLRELLKEEVDLLD